MKIEKILKETFQFIGEACVAWYGAYLAFGAGRLSPGWQLLGFVLMVVGAAGLLHHLCEEPPVSDEWLIGKNSDGMVWLTRRPQRRPSRGR